MSGRLFKYLNILSIVIGLTTANVFGLTVNRNFFPDTFENCIYDSGIHSVLFGNASWELSFPLIETGVNHKLELHFDDLTMTRRTFGYTIVLCDAGWKRSDLSPQEYLTGYGQGTIRESASSFNTTFDYMHYRLIFPEEDCQPILSGNYALIVYDESNPDKMVLIRRFYVSDNSVQIEGRIRQPVDGEIRETAQQIEFTVFHDNSEIRDPLKEVTALLLQNFRYDNCLTVLKPFSIQPGRLEYTSPETGIFQGGNEFRSLDIKSMKYQTENLASIDFQNPYYHVYMKPDESRGYKPYFSKADLNGNYFIEREKSDDKHTEADYVYVHFNLTPQPGYAGEPVYVTGGFYDWNKQKGNQMKFNPVSDRLELTMLLKQGLYDYCFVTTDPHNGAINEYELEGSHFETENDYIIFIYFRDERSGSDRLLGYLSLNQ